jgi:hypothetical protein
MTVSYGLTAKSYVAGVTEIFRTSEGVVVAEDKDGVYDPFCLVHGNTVSVPTYGGEWLPAVRIDERA